MWRRDSRDGGAAYRRAVETAWAIHAAQSDWTGKVDGKATFAFASESAAIATVVALTADDRLYSQIDQGWMWLMYGVGLIGMLAAAGLSAWVVAPRLKTKRTAMGSHENFIYFGHARLWKPEKLEKSLLSDDILPQLTRQIVVMADIAWEKHVLVKWSLWTAIGSGLMLVATGLLASLLG